MTRTTVVAAGVLLALAAGGNAQSPELQQKVAAAKQAAAQNQQALRTYGWLEKTDVVFKGEVKSTKISSCRYGPDGKVQKQPVSASPAPEKKGGLRGRMVALQHRRQLPVLGAGRAAWVRRGRAGDFVTENRHGGLRVLEGPGIGEQLGLTRERVRQIDLSRCRGAPRRLCALWPGQGASFRNRGWTRPRKPVYGGRGAATGLAHDQVAGR